jgi:hypothetical protein
MPDKVLIQTVGHREQRTMEVDERVARHLVAKGRFEYADPRTVAEAENEVIARRTRKDIARAPVRKEADSQGPQPSSATEQPPQPEPAPAAADPKSDGSVSEPTEDEMTKEEEGATDSVIEVLLQATEDTDDPPEDELPPGKGARRRADPQPTPVRRRVKK